MHKPYLFMIKESMPFNCLNILPINIQWIVVGSKDVLKELKFYEKKLLNLNLSKLIYRRRSNIDQNENNKNSHNKNKNLSKRNKLILLNNQKIQSLMLMC